MHSSSDETRRAFLVRCALATGGYAFARLARAAESAELPIAASETDGARITLRRAGAFRILQVTDIHFYNGKAPRHAPENAATIKTLTQLVAQTQPDMLMVTGDLWPNNRDGMGEQYMRYAIEQFESLGVPWGYVWGNHDELPDFAVGHKAFAEAKNSLYRGAASDGNYVIDVMTQDGKRVWQLVCLNSKVEGLGSEQQAWLRALAERDRQPVHRLAFYHIPLKQYDDVWTSGAATGFKAEKVCLEKEDGSTLPFLKALGVKAGFCGHDHVNDYSGVVNGVELVYGRATGTGGYGIPHLRRGGKLISLSRWTGGYRWVSVTEDGKKWHPKRGERIDETKPE